MAENRTLTQPLINSNSEEEGFQRNQGNNTSNNAEIRSGGNTDCISDSSLEDGKIQGQEPASPLAISVEEAEGLVVAAFWHILCLAACLVLWACTPCLVLEYMHTSTPAAPCPSIQNPWPLALLPCGVCMYGGILRMLGFIKRRWTIQNTKGMRILKMFVVFFTQMGISWHWKEQHLHQPDTIASVREAGLPLSIGILFSSALGILLPDVTQLFEVTATTLQSYMIIFMMASSGVGVFSMAVVFLLLCGACFCSHCIIHGALISWEYVKSCPRHLSPMLDAIAHMWQALEALGQTVRNQIRQALEALGQTVPNQVIE